MEPADDIRVKHAVFCALRSGAAIYMLFLLAQFVIAPNSRPMDLPLAMGLSLPPCLLFSAIWGWYFHRLYSRTASPLLFSFVEFLIILFTAPAMPTFPNDISRTIGWRSKRGGDPSTGGLFLILFMSFFLVLFFSVAIRENKYILSRAWIVCIAATFVNASWTARRTQKWKDQGSIQPEPFQPNFSLQAMLLASVLTGGWITFVVRLYS